MQAMSWLLRRPHPVVLREDSDEEVLAAHPRPQQRSDCLVGGPNAQRPCPYVSCRHHLYLEVNPTTGTIKLSFPDSEPWEIPATCSLDVADAHDADPEPTGTRLLKLEAVSQLLGLTRERIRQIEEGAVPKLKAVLRRRQIMEDGE